MSEGQNLERRNHELFDSFINESIFFILYKLFEQPKYLINF